MAQTEKEFKTERTKQKQSKLNVQKMNHPETQVILLHSKKRQSYCFVTVPSLGREENCIYRHKSVLGDFGGEKTITRTGFYLQHAPTDQSKSH